MIAKTYSTTKINNSIIKNKIIETINDEISLDLVNVFLLTFIIEDNALNKTNTVAPIKAKLTNINNVLMFRYSTQER